MLKILILILPLCILFICYGIYRFAFYSSSEFRQDIFDLPEEKRYAKEHPVVAKSMRKIYDLPFERVCITSFDGKQLRGKYYHIQDEAPVQIQFHGYKRNGLRDFCGGTYLSRKMGHNTLVIDQRAHGNSDGKTITFGIKERYDCLNWIQYINQRFGNNTPIILVGISMGAATVLMASELELPENVKGIIADCPYSTPKGIILKVAKDLKFPVKISYPFIYLSALIFGHFRLTDASPAEAVKHTNIPILLIHGEGDGFVPCSMSKEIYDACASKATLVTIPNADHGMSYLEDAVRYEQVILDFLQNCQLN